MAKQHNGNGAIRGGLLSTYFLEEGVQHDDCWTNLLDADVSGFAAAVRTCLSKVPASGRLREAETEVLTIFPILNALGWFHLPQQQAGKRREDVPDALLFLDTETQQQALAAPAGMDRWRQAAVVNENKAWDLPLDRSSGKQTRTPASQALRYLRLADEHTAGSLRWALLTNGRVWRLYYAGAPSVADRFLEVDFQALLEDPDEKAKFDALKTFFLFFRRAAFA